MDKNQKDQQSQQSDNKTTEPSAGSKRENPQKKPWIPLPKEPITPAKPDEEPNPNRPEPGVNEPEKNDPTHTEEPPPIFNNK